MSPLSPAPTLLPPTSLPHKSMVSNHRNQLGQVSTRGATFCTIIVITCDNTQGCSFLTDRFIMYNGRKLTHPHPPTIPVLIGSYRHYMTNFCAEDLRIFGRHSITKQSLCTSIQQGCTFFPCNIYFFVSVFIAV